MSRSACMLTTRVWVPPLKLERYLFLSRKMNAFFTHGEAEYFLAYRDGRVVGRITAQINTAFNEQQQKRWGWFGFVEFEEDMRSLDALLDAAAAVAARARHASGWSGPADFAMNNESGDPDRGLRAAGRCCVQPWHPPYYQRLMEQAGMTKAMDLLMWNLEVADREKVLPVIFELAEKVESDHGIRVRP